MCEQGDVVWMPELGQYGKFIDKCMVDEIRDLIAKGSTTLACCCGHGKYRKTVIVEGLTIGAYEYFTDMHIPRKRRFYKRDEGGVFYIPEVEE